MFSTLESNWDQSARRGWSALASFGFQALALSLLLAVPFIWVQGPPRLTWLQTLTAPAPRAPVDSGPRQHSQSASSSNMIGIHLMEPRWIPRSTPDIRDSGPITPPDPTTGVWGSTGPSSPTGVLKSIGDSVSTPVLKPSAVSHVAKVSHWAEGNVVFRVQPVYPAIARAAGIQGAVILRAIVSKTGTIEHLTVVSGHPMLIKSAVEAVGQWRYRPYLLNDEPIEIDTEITVNFVLSR